MPRPWVFIFSQFTLQSVSSFLPGRIQEETRDNHLRSTTTIFFLYEALKQPSFSWWANMDDSPGPCEEVPRSGSLKLEYWASRVSGVGDRLLQPILPDPASSLPSRRVRSRSWQRCLFLSHLPGFRALSQMPDDLHWPANRAAKPKCFPKAFWESREKGKHDCKLWHHF